MNYQAEKNKTHFLGYLKILILAVVFFSLGNRQIAKAEFTCDQVDKPENVKGYIVTVLEEQIGEPSTGDFGTLVLNCFRNYNVCEADKTKMCSTIGTSCQKDSSDPNSSCKRVQVYFAESGPELLYTYIGRIYRWAAGIIGIVAVLFLVVGGVQISTAGGDAAKIDKAKERIMQSLAGLVVLFLSALILYTINPNFFTR